MTKVCACFCETSCRVPLRSAKNFDDYFEINPAKYFTVLTNWLT